MLFRRTSIGATTVSRISDFGLVLCQASAIQSSGLFVHLGNNVLLYALWGGGGSPAVDDLAIAADEELFKVPLDALEAKQARLLGLEPLVQRRGLVAVDVNLCHDGEGDAVVELAEALDVVVGAGLLAGELVAWEAEDDKVVGVLLGDALVDLLEAGVLAG